MPTPRDPIARRYFRAAGQRLEDAQVVLALTERTTAAVYLAGYCVECLLKALVLTHTPAGEREAVQQQLLVHNFEVLRGMYLARGGAALPKRVLADLSAVATWQPRLRYDPGTIPAGEARKFLAAVERINAWATQRL